MTVRSSPSNAWNGRIFDGFADVMLDTGEAVIRARRGGEVPPILLLHSIPQTHVISAPSLWHRRLSAERGLVPPLAVA